ncbi:endospore germination permease [Paenibacillus sp. FJAT-26967]|uniref:GerAB/ArcD/ProY family transporter n=1 Tax=Paenibacillus sp. FJAT-26967 TaxID=1729690 RepID=UPI000838A336|nr:endospore germination permease [Paenibacillus sp. FJAT-26967]
MNNHPQISNLQAGSILVTTLIGIGVLPLPRVAVLAGENSAPLVTLVAIVVAALIVTAWSLLGIRFPRQSPVVYGKTIIGKWLSGLFIVVITAYFIVTTAITFREFGEVMNTFVLRQTPLEIIIMMMLLLVAVTARKDIYSFSLIHSFYMPFVIFPALFIVILSLGNVDWLNLQPVLRTPDMKFWMGSLGIAALFRNVLIYTYIIPRMENPRTAMRIGIISTSISGGLYLLLVIASVGVFGPQEIKLLLWPTLELGRATIIPGEFLERLDATFLIVWVISVFNSLLSGYYFIVLTLKEQLGLKDHRMIATLLLPFFFLFSMLPQNLLQLYTISSIMVPGGLLLLVGYPCILLVVAYIRKKGGGRVETESV